jgi:hypothetical protein
LLIFNILWVGEGAEKKSLSRARGGDKRFRTVYGLPQYRQIVSDSRLNY